MSIDYFYFFLILSPFALNLFLFTFQNTFSEIVYAYQCQMLGVREHTQRKREHIQPKSAL